MPPSNPGKAKVGSFVNPADDVYHYDPDKHIPDLSSKVIIVTGGNSGIGKATVTALAKHRPKRLYVTARSLAKYDAAMADIMKLVPDAQVDFLEMDLASLASVKHAADQIRASNDRLDILINNAGIMGTPPGTTKEGFEIHFGTNHMGHALFTKLLLPLLLETASTPGADVRIVNLTSEGHRFVSSVDFASDEIKTPGSDSHSFGRYGASKLANILHARELARRYPTITSVACHPGRVHTALLHEFPRWTASGIWMRAYDRLANPFPVDLGAWTELWAATWPNKGDVKSGTYFVPFGKPNPGSKRSSDAQLATRLWNWQEEEFKKLGYT